MRLTTAIDDAVRLNAGGAGFEIDAEAVPLSPFHLLAGGLATCSALTLASWAAAAGIKADDMSMWVTWELTDERPRRVVRIHMEIVWPELPENRVAAAERAVMACPIHATLLRSTEITQTVRTA